MQINYKEDYMNSTPIDEYYFWKDFIETKQENNEKVPDEMLIFLKDVESRMINYLMDKHHSYKLATTDNQMH